MALSEKRSSEQAPYDSKSCLTRGIFPRAQCSILLVAASRGWRWGWGGGTHRELRQENVCFASSSLKTGWCTRSNPMGSPIFVQTRVEDRELGDTRGRDRNVDTGPDRIWVLIPASAILSCRSLGEVHSLFEPQFPHL